MKKDAIVHKRAVLESGFVCGWYPSPTDSWGKTTNIFWDKVTCKKCLENRPNPTSMTEFLRRAR